MAVKQLVLLSCVIVAITALPTKTGHKSPAFHKSSKNNAINLLKAGVLGHTKASQKLRIDESTKCKCQAGQEPFDATKFDPDRKYTQSQMQAMDEAKRGNSAGCLCFGKYRPDPEHQQCMNASPPWVDERLSRAWQAGCWCTNPKLTCQNFCGVQNEMSIRVLKRDQYGQNSWQQTTVAKMVRQAPDMKEEARVQCAMGCQSRGMCLDKETSWSPTPAPQKCQPLPPLLTDIVQYGGDVKCKEGYQLDFGEECLLIPQAGCSCSTSKITCASDPKTEGYSVALSPPSPMCGKTTTNPTKSPTKFPTKAPTNSPTPEPTRQPTFSPIPPPTPMGCEGNNLLPQACNAAAGCSFDPANLVCSKCEVWDGDPTCDTTSNCGLVLATNKCMYCIGASQAACQSTGQNGCTWDGTKCFGAGSGGALDTLVETKHQAAKVAQLKKKVLKK